MKPEAFVLMWMGLSLALGALVSFFFTWRAYAAEADDFMRQQLRILGLRENLIAALHVTGSLVLGTFFAYGLTAGLDDAMDYLSFGGPSLAGIVVGLSFFQTGSQTRMLRRADFLAYFVSVGCIFAGYIGYVAHHANPHALIDVHTAVNAVAKTTLSAARSSFLEAGQEFSSCQSNEQSLLAALRAAGIDSDVSDEELNQRILLATTREQVALGLSDRVAEVEVAVDTAATSAAFQSLRDRILAGEKRAQEADERAKKVEPWVPYFEDVVKLLGGQQAIATKHFINEYGPRTAVIQQRLRPVYGFGEIEVSSNDSAIAIRVHRNGQELRPTDYFSQSQIQTLVLGLFLTACSSQTWSGFSSIMMDDPVTHFDDLNTYALLDLVVGLQSSPEGERQFVISTCDEKLLQLARLKFRHMGDAAKFYRFSAIGSEGPMVNEIPA